jgi:predicted metal-dependent enzyme (double-stranded beta helix superfamily)
LLEADTTSTANRSDKLEFIAEVRKRVATSHSPKHACEQLGPLFADLLADREWLPARYQAAAAESGTGGGIGQWLIFRAADRSLSLFSLVVPTGAMTPVHDHLAWGLVGIYQGSQDEEFYRPRDGRLELLRRRPLDPGDFYAPLPPRDDGRGSSAVVAESLGEQVERSSGLAADSA